MFESSFTIFSGQRYSGRSTLLFTLANILQSQGLKSIFFGGTDEFHDFAKRKQPFELSFFYRREDKKIILNIKELCVKENINFIFVDDIDFMDDESIELLNQCSAKKICTSVIGKNFDYVAHTRNKIKDLTSYEIIQKYDDDTLKLITKLKVNKREILIEDFLKTLERDQKLNNLLK